MTLKAKDLKITFNLDNFTWGDIEDLRRPGGLLDVCERHAEIDGVPHEQVRETLRQLNFKEIAAIDQLLSEAMEQLSDPTNGTGKN